MKWTRILAPVVTALALATAAQAQTKTSDTACLVGAYGLPGGRHVTVTQGLKGELGLLLPDGERAVLTPTGEDGVFEQAAPAAPVRANFAPCPAGRVTIEGLGTASRIAFDEQSFTILAGGVTLAAKLVTPKSGSVRKYAVYVDGSDQTPAIDKTYWQYELPLRGVGILVVDKRGTGGSNGIATADFYLRADDMNAAVGRLREMVGPKAEVGLIGFSQGGWVAPLAASRGPVDFVMVGYGMAGGVTDEDREEIIQNLKEAGFGEAEVAQAVELQAAATAVVRSHWKTGWEHFDELKSKYADAPWVKSMGQEGYTGMMLSMPSSMARQLGPRADQGVSFEYDPAPVIAILQARQLWVLGGDDHGAPSARTLEILTRLQRNNRTLSVAVFPHADHGIVETTKVGDVIHTRLSEGYLDLVAGWIRDGRIPKTPGARVQASQK